ncbi:MAG: FHA domain-containing protein [Polyangiaceae bacterium]|nr:FHA domain-containing protein [Polyangiaceae bacterium]
MDPTRGWWSAYERLGGALRRALEPAALREARAAEARGELVAAGERYLGEGRGADAGRCLARAAEVERSPLARLALLVRARDATPEGERAPRARRVATLRAELAERGELDLTARELTELAGELEAAGELGPAARLYRRAGDSEGETRARIAAGDVDGLEAALAEVDARERQRRQAASTERSARDLFLLGRRRESLEACAAAELASASLKALASEIEARRPARGPLELVLAGAALRVALGDEVVVGRGDAEVLLTGPGVSRRHVALRRGAHGAAVFDLGSSNGTFLGGARIAAPVPVAGAMTLRLGDDATLRVEPWRQGVRIEAAGAVVHAPLGPLDLRRGAELDLDAGGWVCARVPPAAALRLGDLRVDGPIELLRGDRLLTEGNELVLELRR